MGYKIDPDQSLDREIGRIGTELLDGVRADLDRIGNDPREALHDARKKIKKLRGLLRLVRYADKALYASENARLRNAAHGISRFRDAGAALQTLERSVSGDKARSRSAQAVRSALKREERDALAGGRDELDAAIAAVRKACDETGAALQAFSMPGGKAGGKLLHKGYAHVRGQIDIRLAAAAADPSPEAMHELRKAVKYHRMHLQLLRKPLDEAKPRREAVKHLGDLLGDLHDADMLAGRLSGDRAPDAGAGARQTVKRRLLRQRDRLAEEILDEAQALFPPDPKSRRKALKKAF